MRLVCWEDLSSRSMAREVEGYPGDGKTSDEATVVIQGRMKRGGVDRERSIKVGETTLYHPAIQRYEVTPLKVSNLPREVHCSPFESWTEDGELQPGFLLQTLRTFLKD